MFPPGSTSRPNVSTNEPGEVPFATRREAFLPFQVWARRPFELRILGSADGQAVVNILHARLNIAAPAELAPSDSTAILESLRTEWRDNILPVLGNRYSVKAYELWVIGGAIREDGPNPPDTFTYRFSYSDTQSLVGQPADVGGLVGPFMPTFAAVSVAKKGSTGTKILRGGMRLSPLTELQNDNLAGGTGNRLSAAAVAAFDSAIQGLRTFTMNVPQPGETWEWCIASRKRAFDFGIPSTQWFAPWSSYSVSPLVSSQVSRKESRADL